jgi:glycosyltransferase involved in cell wall biosynthesis
MPVYNCERYLRDAIDSILSQTFSDFELVIVDDGSTDGTGAIVDKYREIDPRVVVLHKPNGGIVSALNAGLELCNGEYIARMDGDDICAPNRFAVQVNYLDEHKHCVCVGGNFRGIDEAGKLHDIFRYSRNRLTSFETFPVRVALTCHPLAMFRRSALVGAKGYRNTFPHAEDYDLFLRIADFGRVDNPDELLFYYRGHAGSISRSNVELQETEATYAELAALLAHRGHPDLVDASMDFETARRRIDQVFPPPITAAYVKFRVWRRLVGIDPAIGSRLTGDVLLSALSLAPATLFSKDYWNLRIRILGRFVLNQLEALKNRRKARSPESEARA